MLRALLTNLFPPGRPDASEAAAAAGPDALVQVYERNGRIYIEPSDRTRYAEAGYWIATGDVTVLDGEVSDATLGSAVLAALARSRVEVAVPPRDARLEAGLFRAMRVRSRRAAMTGTRSCLVSREPAERAGAGALQVEALHNGGTRGEGRGYRGVRDDGAAATAPTKVALADATAAAIGAAVRAMLRRATVAD